MTMPLVTVLVPSYNHGRFLEERIESIMAQSFEDFELIVIDDCSKDHSDDVLKSLQKKFKFTYIRNDRNTGTPFAAWERIGSMARGRYIWICESDDVAEPDFLVTAVGRLQENQKAVAFYSNSYVINDQSKIIGHTESYFRDTWKESRWEQDFTASGRDELVYFQLRGQVIPNMSSALFVADAFTKAFEPFLKRLRLTGDWLFVGNVFEHGDVEFCHRPLSRFRKHEETSRVRVQSARSQAEFILTKYCLFRRSGLPTKDFARVMSSDVVRFLYEPTSWRDVAVACLQIAPRAAVSCAFKLVISVFLNPLYWKKFKERYAHAKNWRKESV
ncbi:glycosyltransferase family 2 protein [Pseudorhodoferax sp.]|uniref:glycosyltransferase family 2 protein n=1 Tax=Pseudorhodoferax sp. TaxID=1993553 RepID=UPI0039E6548F